MQQSGELFGGALEEEIGREAFAVGADLVVRARGAPPVGRGKPGIEQYLLRRIAGNPS